jgi:hypothetical protein
VYIRDGSAMKSQVFRLFWVVLPAALGSALWASHAQAANEPSASELSVARRLFEEGRAAEEAGRWREAADKLLRATAIKDTPGMRFHIARCEEEQGRYVEALVEYDRARELLDSGAKAPDVEKLLPEARERVRAKVGLLTLRLLDGVQNVSVELDGKALSAAVLGSPLPVNPGKHRLTAVAVGRAPFVTELEMGIGEVRQLPIELPVANTAPAAPAAPAEPSPAPRAVVAAPDAGGVSARTVALVGEASLFAVTLGLGIGFSVAKSSAQDRWDQANDLVLQQVGGSDPGGMACSRPREGCTELEQARRDRDQYGQLATGAFVGAGVSAAAFGLTYLLWPRRPVDVRASASANGMTLSLSGQF